MNVFMDDKKPVIGAFSSKHESAQATAPSPPNRLRYLALLSEDPPDRPGIPRP
jgi:hypothetical protein